MEPNVAFEEGYEEEMEGGVYNENDRDDGNEEDFGDGDGMEGWENIVYADEEQEGGEQEDVEEDVSENIQKSTEDVAERVASIRTARDERAKNKRIRKAGGAARGGRRARNMVGGESAGGGRGGKKGGGKKTQSLSRAAIKKAAKAREYLLRKMAKSMTGFFSLIDTLDVHGVFCTKGVAENMIEGEDDTVRLLNDVVAEAAPGSMVEQVLETLVDARVALAFHMCAMITPPVAYNIREKIKDANAAKAREKGKGKKEIAEKEKEKAAAAGLENI